MATRFVVSDTRFYIFFMAIQPLTLLFRGCDENESRDLFLHSYILYEIGRNDATPA